MDDAWIKTIGETLYNWLNEDDKRERAAQERNRALIKVHEDGWKATTRTIEVGLKGIADAIRDHGRR